MTLSFKVRVNADIEDVCSIHCQHSDQVTDRSAIKTKTVRKIIAVFNACCELILRPRVI